MPRQSPGAIALPLLPTPPGVARRDKGPFTGAENFLPKNGRRSLTALRRAAATCRGCDLYKHATQTVFGEGSARAAIVMVGEQPGDKEDLAGHPFVGPAGVILDKALAAAGIDRKQVYITNAVKHFKWLPRGKKRLHSRPSARESAACRPWLEYELAALRPRVLVILGATAGQTLLGSSFRVGASRGRAITGTRWAPTVVATIHPSAVLRAPDSAARARELAGLIADLKLASAAAGGVCRGFGRPRSRREKLDAHPRTRTLAHLGSQSGKGGRGVGRVPVAVVLDGHAGSSPLTPHS